MKRLLFLGALVILFGAVNAQTSQKPKAKAKPKSNAKNQEWEMKQYFIVFLKKGPNRSHDSLTASKIQAGHLHHFDSLYAAGKLDIVGPLGDDGEIRGICVYNVATIEEARKLAEMDPAVRSGRLIVEVHPWWAAKGSVLR